MMDGGRFVMSEDEYVCFIRIMELTSHVLHQV
jgi:hypothetical protein